MNTPEELLDIYLDGYISVRSESVDGGQARLAGLVAVQKAVAKDISEFLDNEFDDYFLAQRYASRIEEEYGVEW